MGPLCSFTARQCLVCLVSLFREILRDVRRFLCQKWITLKSPTCFIKPLMHTNVQELCCLIAALLQTLKKNTLLSCAAIELEKSRLYKFYFFFFLFFIVIFLFSFCICQCCLCSSFTIENLLCLVLKIMHMHIPK